jgi:hypothetical protein
MLSERGSDPEFFTRRRSVCVESMTLIDVLPEGELYFYHSQRCGNVWVVSGAHSVIVAYCGLEFDIAQVRRNVEFWDRARQDSVRPDVGGELGGAVYAATENPVTKRLDVAWFVPGDWLGVARLSSLKPHSEQLPPRWPETYRDRLRQLARERAQRRERPEA